MPLMHPDEEPQSSMGVLIPQRGLDGAWGGVFRRLLQAGIHEIADSSISRQQYVTITLINK